MRAPRFSLRLGLPVAMAVAAAGFALPVTMASAASSSSGGAASIAAAPVASGVEQAWADMVSLGQAAAVSRDHAVAVHTGPPRATPVRRRTVAATSSPVASPPASSSAGDGYGCGPALAYLRTHSAPGFVFECPGYADGNQAMTCINVAGLCSGEHLVAIAVPCRAAYLNEASNSWVLTGRASRPIDPYGYCHS